MSRDRRKGDNSKKARVKKLAFQKPEQQVQKGLGQIGSFRVEITEGRFKGMQGMTKMPSPFRIGGKHADALPVLLDNGLEVSFARKVLKKVPLTQREQMVEDADKKNSEFVNEAKREEEKAERDAKNKEMKEAKERGEKPEPPPQPFIGVKAYCPKCRRDVYIPYPKSIEKKKKVKIFGKCTCNKIIQTVHDAEDVEMVNLSTCSKCGFVHTIDISGGLNLAEPCLLCKEQEQTYGSGFRLKEKV